MAAAGCAQRLTQLKSHPPTHNPAPPPTRWCCWTTSTTRATPKQPTPPPTYNPAPPSHQVVLLDDQLRRQLLIAFTEDDRLHLREVAGLLRLLQVRAGVGGPVEWAGMWGGWECV